MTTAARRVDVADVYKGQAVAARLERSGGAVCFEYTSEYLSGRGPAVATTLPLRASPVRTAAGAVPPFFAGLLPEGARLQALIAAVKTSADDELSLLLAVGDDAVGDVRVVPHGELPRSRPASLPEDPGAVSFAELFERSIDPTANALDRALPGVQHKLSDAVVSFPVAAGGGPAILKLSPPAYPRLVENEAVCLGLARTVGLRVPRWRVIADRDGVTGLLVERFDRIATDDGLRRVAQEDACQLLARWPADKYRVSVNEIADQLVEVVSAPVPAILDLTLRVAFAWLIGDGDLHAKNYSLQWREDERLVAPTPAYDVITTLPYPLDPHMALRVDGRDANLRGRYLIEFAGRHGVPATLTRRRLAAIADRLEPHLDHVARIGFDERTTRRVTREMARRIEILRRFD